MTIEQDITSFLGLIQEGIEGVRRQRYYYAPVVTTTDGRDALGVLTRSRIDPLIDMVQDWIKNIPRIKSHIPRPGDSKHKASHLARLCSQFLRTVGDVFSKRLESEFGVSVDIRVSVGVQSLSDSWYRVNPASYEGLFRLHYDWVVRPFLAARHPFTQKHLLTLVDDTVGLLRAIAAVVVKLIWMYSEVSMAVTVSYSPRDVVINTSKASVWRGSEEMPSRVKLTDVPRGKA